MGSQMGMFLTFSKNPRWYTEKKENQDPKICILVLYLHQINKVLIIKNPLPMNTEELSNRLTQIVQGITNTHPIRIKATIEVFLEEFDPSQNYLLSISDIEGYETQFIEFEIWDRNDGPIPGIKLFKDLNIYLEREYCEY